MDRISNKKKSDTKKKPTRKFKYWKKNSTHFLKFFPQGIPIFILIKIKASILEAESLIKETTKLKGQAEFDKRPDTSAQRI